MAVKLSVEKDYYKILGVEKSANAKTIKKKFRALAREHHPDANRGSKRSEEKFKVIAEAYEILSDLKTRKSYDKMRTGGVRGQGRRSSAGRGNWQDPFDFGRQYQRREPGPESQRPFSEQTFQEEPEFNPDLPTRGFDLQFLVDVPFVLACLGGTLPFQYERHVTCTACQGTGNDSAQETCPQCEGATRVVESTTQTVTIPPGVQDQYTLRIPALGGAGRKGGPPGDLLVKVCIQPVPQFKRVKNDIYSEVSIPRDLAENGGFLEVETLEAPRRIEVEENTLTGEEYRIPQAGAFEPWGKKRGDLIIKFRVRER